MAVKFRRKPVVVGAVIVAVTLLLLCFSNAGSGSGRRKRETVAAAGSAAAPSPSKNSVDDDSWTAQELSNLKSMFKRIDATADGKMSRKEIAWFVNRRVNHHMQTALRGNMKKFFALDRKNPNGQVEWAEWLADFESRYDDEQKSTRLYKEKVAAAKAGWGEAARSDPEKLNIDEFLTFTHPEFSHPLIIQDSEATLGLLDEDGDDVLSQGEYTKMASNKVEKLKEFRSIDVDGDGKVNKRELFALFDAKSDFWASREADAVVAGLDADGDGMVDREELLGGTVKELSPLFPERKFHPLI